MPTHSQRPTTTPRLPVLRVHGSSLGGRQAKGGGVKHVDVSQAGAKLGGQRERVALLLLGAVQIPAL